jgi:hypothetical protein
LILGASLRHVDDGPRHHLAHSTGIGWPCTLASDRRSRSQASSRAAESTAMVPGSKATCGLTRSTMLAIRVLPLCQSGRPAPLNRGREFRLLAAITQFTGQRCAPQLFCCGAAAPRLSSYGECWRLSRQKFRP